MSVDSVPIVIEPPAMAGSRTIGAGPRFISDRLRSCLARAAFAARWSPDHSPNSSRLDIYKTIARHHGGTSVCDAGAHTGTSTS